MKEILITIGPDGSTSVETKGFQGAECLKATADIERALGKTTGDVKTPEFRQGQTAKQGA
jgi:DUF2997 family protein